MSVKALLISIGLIVSMAIFVPPLMEIAIYQLPLIWSCLKPPYLYLLINAIILTIAASSRFHHSNPPHIQFNPPPPDFSPASVFDGDEAQFVDVKPVLVNGLEVDGALESDDEIKLVVSSSTWNPPQRINSLEFLSPSCDKPLVSTRFGHRKPLKASSEGMNIRGLRVAKTKKPETLESTWKRITDGRHVPLTRKSDTWENHGLHVDVADYARSVTLRDHTNYEPPPAGAVSLSTGSGGKLRKEASLSQDELNRRVEAFINKFNEEMRLQRQESMEQYTEMVNRGGGPLKFN